MLVGPDNGVLLPLAEALGGATAAFRIVVAWTGAIGRVGTTFDGRDVFAPAAVRLAQGTAPSQLGPRFRPKPYRIPAPSRSPAGARGEVVHVDRFGNLITNVPTGWLSAGTGRIRLTVGRRARTVPRVESYEALGPGGVGVLGSSFGTLEVAAREASAARGSGPGRELRSPSAGNARPGDH